MGRLSFPKTGTGDNVETNLQNTSNATVESDTIADARAGTDIATRRMGGSAVGEMVNPRVDLRVHNTGTAGGGET